MALGARRRPVAKSLRTRLPAEVLKLWPPRESRLVLSGMRVFSGCDRRQLSRIARTGDVVEVGAGDVLVREDYTDYWFFVILEGSARVVHRGRQVAKLHRGDHFGELAIIGFRPQEATVTAAEPTVLFVLSRQHLLSLVSLDVSVQRALFPEVKPADFPEFRQKLQTEGRRSWDRLVPRQRRMLQDVGDLNFERPMPRPPGRTMSWDEALDQLSHLDRRPKEETRPETVPIARWSSLIAVGVVVAVLVVVAALFHPPLAVVTPTEPVDVVRDISITGTNIDKPNGRYLMTIVNVDRPSLARVLFAWALRRTVVPVSSPDRSDLDLETERQRGRDSFRQSHKLAVELAERELGVDATGITIAIRDRGITGPSAGLIYALAIVDMLDDDDLAGGRVIAATGELQSDATVGRVGFVRLKATEANDAGASLFIVPSSQRSDARHAGLRVVGVGSLKEAVRAIAR